MTVWCRLTRTGSGNMVSRGARQAAADGVAQRAFPKRSIGMYVNLLPYQMVCIPCHRRRRDRFIITDAIGYSRCGGWIAINQGRPRRNRAM